MPNWGDTVVWGMIDEVLARVVFILFPLLFYLVFLYQKECLGHKKVKTFFIITMIIALILTMTFPTGLVPILPL